MKKISLIEWDEEYSVGIDEIDEQHKKILKMINMLAVGIMHEKEKPVVAQTLKDMEKYIGQHFTYEEKKMEQAAYENAEEHSEEHQIFSARFGDFFIDYNSGNDEVAEDMLSFLSDWLIKHIMNTDKKYIPALLEAEKKNKRRF